MTWFKWNVIETLLDSTEIREATLKSVGQHISVDINLSNKKDHIIINTITKSMHAFWLVNQLWFIVPVNPWKNRASSELLYKSNRPQVSMVYRLINHLGCYLHTWRDHRRYGYVINRAFESKLIWYFTGVYIINRILDTRLWIWILSCRGQIDISRASAANEWDIELTTRR